MSIYGARAAGIAALAAEEPALDRAIDPSGRVSAAEIAFVTRHERPRTLADIVFRRTMLGLDADQARPLYASIAAIAGVELGWNDDEVRRQNAALERYAQSLRPEAAV